MFERVARIQLALSQDEIAPIFKPINLVISQIKDQIFMPVSSKRMVRHIAQQARHIGDNIVAPCQ